MKTNLDKLFKTDANLEKNGVWFDISSDIGFLLRPIKTSSPTTKAAFAAHFKPYARQIELGTLDQDKQNEVHIKIFIEASLVDWKGVEIDGAFAAFTPENAMKFFKALPDLFETLWKHASDFNNYREDLGNS